MRYSSKAEHRSDTTATLGQYQVPQPVMAYSIKVVRQSYTLLTTERYRVRRPREVYRLSSLTSGSSRLNSVARVPVLHTGGRKFESYSRYQSSVVQRTEYRLAKPVTQVQFLSELPALEAL